MSEHIDDIEVPSQDDLNRMLFAEMQSGRRAAARGRRVVQVFAVVAVVFFTIGGYLIDRQTGQINEGRKVSSDAVCAFGSALAEAGRAVFDAAAAPPKDARARRFERELERIGYPPRDQRQGGGQAYVDNIALRVATQTGIKGLVVKTGPNAGQLNCDRLQQAAKIR